MAVSSKHSGWRYDATNARLDFYFQGTRVFHATASGIVLASGKVLDTSAGSMTSAAGEIGAADLSANLKTGFIPLPLGAWRLVASNDVPAIAVASGNGGNLGVDTAPKLKRVSTSTDKKMRIEWAASSSVEIMADVVYPPDLDDTATVTLNLLLAKDTNTDNTVTVAAGYFEGVGDTNAGGNTAALAAATLAQKTVVIAAADVGTYPNAASVTLTPGTHTTDAIYLYGSWLTYTRKS
jgi:hypothetical protein